MIESGLALREAWRTTFRDLGIRSDAAVIVGGPPAEIIGDAVPIGVSDGVAGLVSLGSGPQLDPLAVPVATRLDEASIDVVMMLSSWADVDGLTAVAAEAMRITRRDGTAILGQPDLGALIGATPTTHLASLLASTYPDVVRRSGPTSGVAGTARALQRARFRSVSERTILLPVGVFDDPDGYIAAVLGGMWPGVDSLSDAQRAALVGSLRTRLHGATPPIFEYQPWRLASGVRGP